MSFFMKRYEERVTRWLNAISECPAFPTLMRGCRHAMGVSRERIANYLDISEHKLKRIELGLYKRDIDELLLMNLKELYDLDDELFFRSYDMWIDLQQKETFESVNY